MSRRPSTSQTPTSPARAADLGDGSEDGRDAADVARYAHPIDEEKPLAPSAAHRVGPSGSGSPGCPAGPLVDAHAVAGAEDLVSGGLAVGLPAFAATRGSGSFPAHQLHAKMLKGREEAGKSRSREDKLMPGNTKTSKEDKTSSRYDSFERFMAEDSTEDSSIGDMSGNFSPGGSKSSLDSSFRGRSYHKDDTDTKKAGGHLGGKKNAFAPMKPGQFAASLGFKPVHVSRAADPLPEKPVDKPATVRTSQLSKSKEEDESYPRKLLVQTQEEKPVHPRPPSPAVEEAAVEEEIEAYEDDWDEDDEAHESPRPRKDDEKANEPLAAQAGNIVDEYKKVPTGESQQTVSKEAQPAGQATQEAQSKKTVFRELDFSEALKDQSYATDSETEEEVKSEKRKFFEEVAKMGQVDYSALNRNSEVQDKKVTESEQPKVESSKPEGEANLDSGAQDYLDKIRSSEVSVKASWTGYNLEETLTDSPAKRAVSESTLASTEIVNLLAAAEANEKLAIGKILEGSNAVGAEERSEDVDDSGAKELAPSKTQSEGFPTQPKQPSIRFESVSDAISQLMASADANEHQMLSQNVSQKDSKQDEQEKARAEQQKKKQNEKEREKEKKDLKPLPNTLSASEKPKLPPKPDQKSISHFLKPPPRPNLKDIHGGASASADALKGSPSKTLPPPVPSVSPAKGLNKATSKMQQQASEVNKAPRKDNEDRSANFSSKGDLSSDSCTVNVQSDSVQGIGQSQEAQVEQAREIQVNISRAQDRMSGTREGSVPQKEVSHLVPSSHVRKEVHDKMIQEYEEALSELRQQHFDRIREMAEQHDKELQETKERNFALAKRVDELEGMDMVKTVAKGGKIPANITEEDRERLEKTIREQEVLLQAYQKENERITAECKALQAQAREKDHSAFLENQKLNQQIKHLQEETEKVIRRSSGQAGDLASKLEVARVVEELEGERRQNAQQQQELKFVILFSESSFVLIDCHQEIDRLRKAKKELEGKLAGVDLNRMLEHENEVAQLQALLKREKMQFELEKTDLMARIQNDQLLKSQEREIGELKRQVYKLEEKNSSLGTELENSGIKGESKLVRNLKKKIAELEREKKERDQEHNIVKDLIRAAQPSAEESQLVQELQVKVKSLEKELDDAHVDTEKRIRVLRQETENARTAYEKRIASLQTTNKELSNKLLSKQGGKETSLSKKEVDKQMSDIRTFYQKKLKDLEKQLEEANRAIQRQNAPGRLLNQDQRKQVEASEDQVLRTSQSKPESDCKATTKDIPSSDRVAQKGQAMLGNKEEAESVPMPDHEGKVQEARKQPEQHHAGGKSMERPVKVAWGPSRAEAEDRRDAQGHARQAETDEKDRRIQELEEQLKTVQTYAREQAGGMYPEYMQASLSDPSVNSMRYHMMMMQQRLKESERAREVAELTLHAVEQSTKSVSRSGEERLSSQETAGGRASAGRGAKTD
eukprot:764624-Hanusia_phi.AAC.1